MILPGGLIKNGRRYRDFKLKTPGGDIELALYDAMNTAANHPLWVSESLLAVLESLADAKPTLEDVQSLCLADRQAIAIAWWLETGQTTQWRSIECCHCLQPFDIAIPIDQLPQTKAASQFPFCYAQVGEQRIQLRAPNGFDLEALGEITDTAQARTMLAKRLILDANYSGMLNDDCISAIEQAIEAMVPEIVTELHTTCPECGNENITSFDPYQWLHADIDELLDEVHIIAQHYHWKEKDILKLPTPRRHQYLKRIQGDTVSTRELL